MALSDSNIMKLLRLMFLQGKYFSCSSAGRCKFVKNTASEVNSF